MRFPRVYSWRVALEIRLPPPPGRIMLQIFAEQSLIPQISQDPHPRARTGNSGTKNNTFWGNYHHPSSPSPLKILRKAPHTHTLPISFFYSSNPSRSRLLYIPQFGKGCLAEITSVSHKPEERIAYSPDKDLTQTTNWSPKHRRTDFGYTPVGNTDFSKHNKRISQALEEQVAYSSGE